MRHGAAYLMRCLWVQKLMDPDCLRDGLAAESVGLVRSNNANGQVSVYFSDIEKVIKLKPYEIKLLPPISVAVRKVSSDDGSDEGVSDVGHDTTEPVSSEAAEITSGVIEPTPPDASTEGPSSELSKSQRKKLRKQMNNT